MLNMISKSKRALVFFVASLSLLCVYVVIGQLSVAQSRYVPLQPTLAQALIVNATEPALERSYKETNSYWVNRVREYCADYKKLINVYAGYVWNFGLPTYVWIASDYHKLFYCAAPKCSSTTWVTYIMQDQNMTWKGDTHA